MAADKYVHDVRIIQSDLAISGTIDIDDFVEEIIESDAETESENNLQITEVPAACNIDFSEIYAYNKEDSKEQQEEDNPIEIGNECTYEYEEETPDCIEIDSNLAALKAEQQWVVIEDENDDIIEVDEETSYIKQENELEEQVEDCNSYIEENEENNVYNEQYLKDQCEAELPATQIPLLIDVKNELAEEGDDQYICVECGFIFTDYDAATDHICGSYKKVNETDEEYCCNRCKIRTFSSSQQLLAHQKFCFSEVEDTVRDVKNLYSCNECGKTFKTLKAYTIHGHHHKMNTVEPEVPVTVTCEICNTVFSSAKNLKFHMRIHKEHKPKSVQEALPEFAKEQYNELNQFYCQTCNKSFERTLLNVHKRMHLKSFSYSCGICNRYFSTLISYKVHQRMHAEKQTLSSPIQEANKIKLEKQSDQANPILNPHKKFACQYCGHLFARPYEKVKHERIHTGEKPYSCDVCGKRFRVSYSLTIHLRTHTNLRPYVCATCNKRFKNQAAYAHHLKIHSSIFDYKCDMCSKSFRTAVQLYSHKNSHTRPYGCPICSRSFASLHDVNAHIRTHNKSSQMHENLKTSCRICGAVYERQFSLRVHMRTKHGIDVDVQIPSTVPATAIKAEDHDTASDGNDNADDTDTALLIAAAAAEVSMATVDGIIEEAVEGEQMHIVDNGQMGTYIVSDMNAAGMQEFMQHDEVVSSLGNYIS